MTYSAERNYGCVAVVTYHPDLWGAIHLIKLFTSVIYNSVSEIRLSLHDGEKWTLLGHSSFPPTAGFTNVRLSLPQWLEIKSSYKVQTDTFARVCESQINFIFSICTIILQNTFHVDTFPSIAGHVLFIAIEVSSKQQEHA